MIRYTLKQLNSLVREGVATDLTNTNNPEAIPEDYRQIGYSAGIYGCNGKLLKGKSGRLYAITDRTQAIYVF